MQTWQQVYDPLGNIWLSSLIAALPILFFFVALAVLRMKGHLAGTLTVVLALLVSVFFYKMPIKMALAAAGDGFLFGLWPIAWIIITAVFLYKVTVTNRAVRDHPCLGGLRDGRPAPADASGRLLFRRVSGGRGRLWRSGGHHGRSAGRTGLQSALRRGPLPHRQYCAGGLRRNGDSSDCCGAGHRHRSVHNRRNGGPPTALSLLYYPLLDHRNHGRLARRARNLACDSGLRRQLRGHTVSDLQFYWPAVARYHLGPGQPALAHAVSQVLEAEEHLPFPRPGGRGSKRSTTRPDRCSRHGRPSPS